MNRLWFRLVASLSLVVLLGSILPLVMVRRSLDRGMERLLIGTDQAYARELVDAARLFIEAGGSLEEFSQLLGAVPRGSPFARRWPERGMAGGPPGMMPMMHRATGLPGIAITDVHGTILFHTIENRDTADISRLAVQRGLPLRVDGELRAYIFVGSMVAYDLGPLQADFLASVQRASLVSALLGLVLALLIGSLLFIHIMAPLRSIRQAAAQVAAGRLDCSLVVRRDDDLGQISTGFNQMLQALRDADAWKRRLVVDAAHELRTPVSLMQTRLELLQDGVYPLDQANIAVLHDNVRLLGRLLHDLQELSSAEAGMLRLQPEDFDLPELLGQIRASFLPDCRLKSLSLELAVEGPCTVVVIRADRGRLTQVINNLLANAVTASQPGGRIVLRLLPATGDGWFELHCVDSGPGIPEEERERIFERFYRLDTARQRSTGNSGLGLAISREIVHRHGGSLRVEANPDGDGSRFVLRLPLRTPLRTPLRPSL